MDELMAASKDPVPGMRRVKILIILAYVETDSDTLFVFLRQIDFSPQAAVSLMHTFCQETKADYSQFIPALFRGMINLMNDSDELVVEMSWNALNAVTKVTINTVACFGPSVCKRSRRECRALAQSDKRREAGDGSLPLYASATCLLVFLRN